MKPQSAKEKGRRLERRAAKVLGGQRAPLSGAVGGSDVWGTRFSVECKARKEIPALIKHAFGQAERDLAIGDQRLPLVVIQADRSRPIACLYLDDFQALLEESGVERGYQVREACRAIRKLASEIEELAK